jgi:hypothetical protein
MKGKTELLTNFKWIFKNLIPTVEMLKNKIQSLCNFSFLKIVEIEPANKVQSCFTWRDAFSAHKTSLFISFTSLIGMEWTKASLVGMGPIQHGTIFFYFKIYIFEEVFVLPGLPSNEKNSFDHHNSYNKGPNLACNGHCLKALSNPHLPKKFQKIHL